MSYEDRKKIQENIRNNSTKVKAILAKRRIETYSFVEPVTFKMSRTTQSVPQADYTSVSRIAKR